MSEEGIAVPIAIPIATSPSRFDTRVGYSVVGAETAAAIRQTDSSTLFMRFPFNISGIECNKQRLGSAALN